MKYINFKNMSIAMILLVIFAIVSQYASYNRTQQIIEEHDCVPTNHATQEFDGNRASTTKVYYQCNDHGRWLESYDSW